MTSEAAFPINRICVSLQDSLALSLFILRWLMRSALIARCSALSLNTREVQMASCTLARPVRKARFHFRSA